MPDVHLLCDVRARHVDHDSLRMCCTLNATVRVCLNLVYLRFDKFLLQSEIYKARTGNGRFFVKGFLPQISDDSFRYLTRLFLKLFRHVSAILVWKSPNAGLLAASTAGSTELS